MLGLLTIVKNEYLYLSEFIEYYKLQGVTHFWIADNESDDDTPWLLEQYQNEWPNFYVLKAEGSSAQMPFYRSWLTLNRQIDFPVLVVDCDEFVTSKGLNLNHDINNVLHSNNTHAINIPWKLFGSSGIETYDDRLVIEKFLHHENTTNPHFKTCLIPKYFKDAQNPHDLKVRGDTIYNGDYFGLYVNHYHTKSKDEYRIKCQKPRADTGETRDFESSFIAHDRNEVRDEHCLQFVNRIKENIIERKWNRPE